MFENDASMQPSHLLYCLAIFYMIQSARDEGDNIMKPHLLKLLSFLSDHVDIKSMSILYSLEHFRVSINDYCRDAEVIDSICDYCREVKSIDHLIDFMDKLKNIFEIDSTVSSNNLYGPNKITVTSSLGIFVRRVSSYWECMPFESQCTVIRDFTRFCESKVVASRKENSHLKVNQLDYIRATDDSMTDMTSETKYFIDETEAFLLDNNITAAEKCVHNFFDTLAQDPLAIRYRGQEIKSLDMLLQELRLIESGRSATLPKHQFAMMTLALTWISAGNFSMAQSAVEEALKSSHQRGDHPSVVKSLLLLFHIMENSSDFDASRGEELLRRCITKSGALGLNELVADAVLSFVKLKINQLSNIRTEETIVEQNIFDADSVVEWGFEEIWNLLTFGLHGETSLTVQYCLTKDPGSIDDVAASSGPGAMQQPGKVITESFNPVDGRYVEFNIRSSILYCDLWNRIQQYDIAVLYCNKAINLYAHEESLVQSQYLLVLTGKLIFNQLQCLIEESGDASERLLQSLNSLYCNYQQLQMEFENNFQPCSTLPNKFNAVFRVISNYLSVYLCCCVGDTGRANRFSEKMIDALGDGVGNESILPLEDRLRCMITKEIVGSLLVGTRQSIIMSHLEELCSKMAPNNNINHHLIVEPATKWLICKSNH